jgi:uncharacterized protein (TIGR03435 family)
MRAYNLKAYEIEGPNWLDSDRFNVTAKLPDGAEAQLIPEMLRNFLQDRFKMRTHFETKPSSVYALTANKGPVRLVKSEQTGSPSDSSPAQLTFDPKGRLELKGSSIGALADMLANFLDNPVLDETGISGIYDLTLDISMQDLLEFRTRASSGALRSDSEPSDSGGHDGSIFGAIRQIGLKLERKKVAFKHLIIDSAEKVPTAN